MLAHDGDDENTGDAADINTSDAADVILNLLDLALDLETEYVTDTSADALAQPLSPGALAQMTMDLLVYAESWDTQCVFILNARAN